MKRLFDRLNIDPFTLALLATVAAASLVPARGESARVLGVATNLAIALLFFLHGAKLSRQAILAGAGHWRLHLTVFTATFVMFPLLGLAAGLLSPGLVSRPVAAGLLYLCLLPSTVQSSIAFTSIAGGNVAAAVCSASASSLLGILLTPLLVGLLMEADGSRGVSLGAVEAITLQLLVPFLAGHLSRPLTGRFVDRHKRMLNSVDRGSILMVVFTAFSAAVVEGLWRKLAVRDLLAVGVLDLLILATALAATTLAARALRFSREDEITVVFCGSKKSLASGAPMAAALFPAAQVGALIVPLMLYHQIQLMVCAVLARRYAARGPYKPAPRPVEAAA